MKKHFILNLEAKFLDIFIYTLHLGVYGLLYWNQQIVVWERNSKLHETNYITDMFFDLLIQLYAKSINEHEAIV